MKHFLQGFRRWLRGIGLQFMPILSSLAMSFLTMALMFGALLIMVSPAKLGRLFWPTLIAYLGGIAAVVAALHHRREMREFRALVGDEEFFRIYPRLRRREERRKRRQARKNDNKRKGRNS